MHGLIALLLRRQLTDATRDTLTTMETCVLNVRLCTCALTAVCMEGTLATSSCRIFRELQHAPDLEHAAWCSVRQVSQGCLVVGSVRITLCFPFVQMIEQPTNERCMRQPIAQLLWLLGFGNYYQRYAACFGTEFKPEKEDENSTDCT